jgi:hypothetical protein
MLPIYIGMNNDPDMKVSLSASKQLVNFVMFAVVLVAPSAMAGSILPPDRLMDWTVGTRVGVPGGIPNRLTVYTNMLTAGADNTGSRDCSALVQMIAAKCPSNQVIYFPSGTYRFTNAVNIPNYDGITLRGAGMGKTVFDIRINSGVNGAFNVGQDNYPRPAADNLIISGAIAGSTNVIVSNTTTVIIGRMIRIEELNPDWVHTVSSQTNRNLSFMFMVTSKDATNVSFWPPLPFTLTNRPALAGNHSFLTKAVGFEDLTFEMTNGIAASAIFWHQVYGCWMKGVEIANTINFQTKFVTSINCEMRGCFTHDTKGTGPSHEGIDLVGYDCWNLIEDNICVKAGYPMIVLGDGAGGCSGNVIGYNYAISLNGSYTYCDNHGPHNIMNLFEGNIGQTFTSDGYYGSASHTTLFRNAFSGLPAPSPWNDWPMAVNLCRWAYYYNIVGNVLGSSGYSASYTTEVADYSALTPVIYRLGYPNVGNSWYSGTNPPSTNLIALDKNVKNTVIRHGNFDFATASVIWDASITSTNLPASLYLMAKPLWWPSALQWPAIGPDRNPMVGGIPAELRYKQMTGGLTPPTGLKVLP